MIEILAFSPADTPDLETLLDAAFGPARRNRTAYRLRDGVACDPALSFVARDAGRMVGSLQCWPLQIRALSGSVAPLTLLGPVVTAADRQGEGIASRLMTMALAAIDRLAAPPVLLIGDAPFYGRFGFTADATGDWLLPGPVDRARLLLRGAATALPRLGWVEPAAPRRRAA